MARETSERIKRDIAPFGPWHNPKKVESYVIRIKLSMLKWLSISVLCPQTTSLWSIFAAYPPTSKFMSTQLHVTLLSNLILEAGTAWFSWFAIDYKVKLFLMVL